MDIKITEKSLRQFLKTSAKTEEIVRALSLCGPTVDRYHKIGDDTVFEIESITNRVDTTSVFGVAREANAILQQMGIQSKLVASPYEEKPLSDKNLPNSIKFQVAETDLISRFTSVTFVNCTVKDSDQSTQNFLKNCGQRPLNNLIDITNELTILYGLPTHIFDLDKMATQKLLIRQAKKGESVTTLDGQISQLEVGDIVIEDGLNRIIDLCGIMGGGVCEVDDHTKNILFIAPVYRPQNIRQTSLRLQKRTLAAQIYEKTPDTSITTHMISLAGKLIAERSGGKPSTKVFDLYPKEPVLHKVSLNQSWLKTFAGIEIPQKSIVSILENLGFTGTKIAGDKIQTTPPTFRAHDISIPEDIAEEIVRIYGYYQIPGNLPFIRTSPETPNKLFELENRLRHTISILGYHEICNNSLISLQQINNYLDNPNQYLRLNNALSSDFEYLRTSLVPSTLTNHKNNLGKSSYKQNFFEIANVYLKSSKQLPDEISTLCVSTDRELLDLKKDLEAILNNIQLPNYNFVQTGPTTADILVDNTVIGIITSINSQTLENFGITHPVSCFQIDLTKLIPFYGQRQAYEPISAYPDLKLEVTLSSKLKVGEIIEKIKSISNSIYKVKYLTKFENKYSFEVILRSYTKNLTKDFGKDIQTKIFSEF